MTICVIPARLASMRLPEKVLLTLGDKPLLQHVYEAACKTSVFDKVVFAIDDPRTARLIETFSAPYYMTSVTCQSGTDRLVELMDVLEADIFVNWQADEPFVTPVMISDLLKTKGDGSDVWTLKTPLAEGGNPHEVKVVTRSDGRALYFSREAIPHGGPYFKHIGIYAFSRQGLEKIRLLSPSALERAERLEQLRFLENGLEIRVHETTGDSIGIDDEKDFRAAELLLTLRR